MNAGTHQAILYCTLRFNGARLKSAASDYWCVFNGFRRFVFDYPRRSFGNAMK